MAASYYSRMITALKTLAGFISRTDMINNIYIYIYAKLAELPAQASYDC